jgi:hypothetical protein
LQCINTFDAAAAAAAAAATFKDENELSVAQSSFLTECCDSGSFLSIALGCESF